MPDRFIESHIRKLPLFSQLPPEHMGWITDAFRVLRVEPGELIFQQGQRTRGLYMLISGRAQLIRSTGQGPVEVMGEVHANQYLNEGALFQVTQETASLRAVEPTSVLFLSRENLMDVISLHPEIKPYLPIPLPAVQAQVRERAFRGQRENEQVLLNTRRHWWTLVRYGWFPVLVFGVILILSAFIPSAGVAFGVTVFTALVVGLVLLYVYIEWRNDQIIITDQRVIHIEHVIHRFSSRIDEVPLTSIIQVNAEKITADPFSRVLDFGTVELKTAGDAGNMRLRMMPRPDVIQDTIFDYRAYQEERQEVEHRGSIRAEVDKVLGRQSTAEPETSSIAGATIRRPLVSPWQTKFEDEKGDTYYRKHLIVYVRSMFLPALAAFGAMVLFVLSLGLPTLTRLGVIVPTFAFFLFLVSALWAYWVDWDWRNDYYVVGDTTIQLIHRRPLWLQNEDDQALLASVDNVVSQKGGFLQNLFNYGNVRISLIGGDKNDAKVFRIVGDPQEVQAEITRRQARLKRRAAEVEERRRRDEIAEYLSVYHETVNAGSQPRNANAPVMPQYSNPPAPTDVEPPPRPVFDRMRPPKVPKMRKDRK